MVDTTFYFAEWEVEGSFGFNRDRTKSRDELIKEALTDYAHTDEPVAVTDDGRWYIGGPKEFPNFIVGKFGKEYTDEAERYDEDEGDFVEKDEPNTEADYAFYILHFEYNMLIYNTRNRVGHQQFIKYFSRGFADTSEGSLKLGTKFIRNNDNIDEVLDEYPVLAADIELEPSNPHSDPEWEELDNHIQNMLASKLQIDIDSIEGESLRVDEELLEQILTMSTTQYGEFAITYVQDGNTKLITSDEDDPISQTDERPSSVESMRQKADELIEYAKAFV